MEKRTATALLAVVAIALIAVASFHFSALTGFTAMAEQRETVKVGLLVPLTGSTAAIGEDVRNAILLALEDIEKEQGNAGIELVVEDSQCDARQAVTAFKKLADADEVSSVIGVVCSGVAEAIGPIANEEGIPVMLSVASSFEPKEGGYVFKFWPSNSERAAFEARFLAEELGINRIAVVYENDARSTGLAKLFEEKSLKLGPDIVIAEAFEPSETDFRASLLKVKDSEPEAVFIFAYEQPTLNILKQAKELGLEYKFFATSTILSQEFLDSSGGIADGLIIDLPVTRNSYTTAFEERFSEKYKDEILHPGSYFAYDSLVLLSGCTKKSDERQDIKECLYSKKTEGISGVIDFDSTGRNKEKKEFAVLEVRNGKFVQLEN